MKLKMHNKFFMLVFMLLSASITAFCDVISSNVASKHIHFSQANEIDPNMYVLNGLVAWYDGEWNAGIGIHDNNASVWIDISGNGNDLIKSSSSAVSYWEENCLRSNTYRRNVAYAVASTPLKFETCEWVV